METLVGMQRCVATSELNIHFPYDPSTSILCIRCREMNMCPQKTYQRVPTATIFHTLRTGKKQTLHEQVNWQMCTLEC